MPPAWRVLALTPHTISGGWVMASNSMGFLGPAFVPEEREMPPATSKANAPPAVSHQALNE